jgi:hypothetical protein
MGFSLQCIEVFGCWTIADPCSDVVLGISVIMPICFNIQCLSICAAGFALLNLPKGKSLGRSKPATSSYAQALQHTVWDSYYIQALLNCLMRNKISITNVSELGYLFHDESSLHIIA